MHSRSSRPRLLQAMIDAFSLPDLRQKLLITFIILLFFRFVAHVPVTGVNTSALRTMFQQNALLGMLDLFSGGGLRNFSVAAIGIYPYINASIILQLLTPVIPALTHLAEEGETGRNKINILTYWVTIPLAAISGYGTLTLLQRGATPVVGATDLLQTVTIVVSLIAGTMFTIWLGQLITDYGIGNGISILIAVNIIAGYPELVGQGILAGQQGQIFGVIFYAVVSLATIVAIVVFTEAYRAIPVQYAKSVFKGGRMYRQSGGTRIPLRVDTAGMIPVIFASSLVLFPGVIASYFASPAGAERNIANYIVEIFSPNTALPLGFVYWVLLFLLTIGFSFFYTTVIMEQQNLPGSLQGKRFYLPSDQGFEKQINARLKSWREGRKPAQPEKGEGE